MNTPAAERLPLTGADCFLRAFDAETRRTADASHLSQMILRLGPGFDADAFSRVLAEVVDANPVLRAPIRRPYGLGPPVYRLDLARRVAPPALVQHQADGDGDAPLPALFARRLNEVQAGRRGELLKVDAVRRRGDGSTDLAFTWLHMLLDGSGSERFAVFLEDCRAGTRTPDAVPDADRPGAPPDVPLPAQRERGGMAMSWQRWMTGLGARPTRSLAGPLRRTRQDLVVERVAWDAARAEGVRERAAARAGFLTPMLFYLAAAVRAHHAVLRKRGREPAAYVVPLPVDLRPRGREGGLFRTRVSLVWFQVPASLADDEDALLDALKQQRRSAIRDRQVENGVAAMDYARHAPVRVYAYMARRALRGELCSFFFAYTDAFCAGLDCFFGAPVRDGFHAPSVPPSPGSGLAFSWRPGRLGYTHVQQRGVLDDAERGLFRASLESDLLGGA